MPRHYEPRHDKVLTLARAALRIFLVLNIAAGVAFILVLLASVPFGGMIASRLLAKYGPSLDVAQVMLAMRLLLAGGLVAGVALHRVFAGLLAILATVREGDPFTMSNARRLQMIAWAMLVLQLLDLVLGGFAVWFSALHVEFSTWSPALGGWIAVLMLFVLARVFETGARMRDDLAMTV